MPLAPYEDELIAAAAAARKRHFLPWRHRRAAASRDGSCRIFTGIPIGATMGRLSVCAEAVALARALIEGDGTVAVIVALRPRKPDEEPPHPAVAPPSGARREMRADHAHSTQVILPGAAGLVRVPASLLLPLPCLR